MIVLVEECAINGMRVKDSIHNLLSAHLPQYLFKGHVDSYNLKWHMCVQSSNYIHWRICKTLYKHISKFFCLLECSTACFNFKLLPYLEVLIQFQVSLSDNIDFPKRVTQKFKILCLGQSIKVFKLVNTKYGNP